MKIKRFLFQWVAISCVTIVAVRLSADSSNEYYEDCEPDEPLCQSPETCEECIMEIDGGVDEGEGEDETPSFRYQRIHDFDDDGILDSVDNCPFEANSSDGEETQRDYDGDGVGDVCDNCANVANADQKDRDGDRIGDACDRDVDGDYVLDPVLDENVDELDTDDQTDSDNGVDTEGQTDSDSESDTVQDTEDGIDGGASEDAGALDGGNAPSGLTRGGSSDNCPEKYNPGQEDLDRDGAGDACDDDIDGDGEMNGQDACPFSAMLSDPVANADCMGDSDSDGILNFKRLNGQTEVLDNCPDTPNPGQEDFDGDGLGDACDDDIDADEVQNSRDNCFWRPDEELYGVSFPTYLDEANADQKDRDRDGQGDACDNKFCFVVPSLASRYTLPDEDISVDIDELKEEEKEALRQKLVKEAQKEDTNLDIDRGGEPRFCLNPQSPEFVVKTPHILGASSGNEILLRLFANRVNAALHYEWTLIGMPMFEAGVIRNPVGATGYSTPFEYNYADESTPVLVAKEPGYYTVRLRVEEVFPDPITGKAEQAEATATIYVSGTSLLPVSECNCLVVGHRQPKSRRDRLLTFLTHLFSDMN